MEFYLSFWGEGGDEPVVSHEEPGAADHSSVELNGMYCSTGSCPLLFDRIMSSIIRPDHVLYCSTGSCPLLFNRSMSSIVRPDHVLYCSTGSCPLLFDRIMSSIV